MTYVAISFLFSWAIWLACWLLARHVVGTDTLTPIVIAGSFGPFLASGICAATSSGLRGMIAFYRRGLDWRMGWLVFCVSVVLLPMLAIFTASLFHQPDIQIPLAELPLVYLWLFVLGGPLAEEFGWSYLSDLLDARFSIAFSTFLLAIVWGFWHLPLFFLSIPGLEQKFIPFPLFLFMSVTARFLFSWSYHRSGRNILSNLLIHNGLNLSLSLVPIVLPLTGSLQPRLICLCTLTGIFAAVLWWALPPRRKEYLLF
jgi:cbb3-type cytochrome oxidase subunit 3